ncbi:LacI family DNA-binding transcriptional regulator [Neobacillus sp. D3-1R]|uniref:LacI family DNA-binding transcriptional regulator n=1 Tax=Neobacillus sp. D3-1R TaxID=3445778 RepID=UPI003FA0E835
MSVSIKDVAKKCGLSVSTVSRALNNQYGVSQKAIQLVQQAVKELGYVQDQNAKDLVSKKSNLVGVIIPETDFEARPAFFEILPYLSQTLALYQKEMIISPVTVVPHQYESQTLEMIIRKRKLDGCIILPGFISAHPIYKEAKKLSYPIVCVGENIISRTCSNINIDDQKGASMAVNHLLANGHRAIGFINGPSHANICLERLEGYKQAMHEAGISWEDNWMMESDFTGEGGAKSIERLLQTSPTLTACFFANDLMAIGALAKLTSLGIRVPDDFSIIGYDGNFLTKYTSPPLSTVTLHSSKFGIKIAELLVQLINGGTGKSEKLAPHLISRESVKKI